MTSFSSNMSSKKSLLKDLLHVPQIAKNILSISQFTRNNCVYVEFHFDYCYVTDKISNQVLLQGKVKDGLYVFEVALDKNVKENEVKAFNCELQ